MAEEKPDKWLSWVTPATVAPAREAGGLVYFANRFWVLF